MDQTKWKILFQAKNLCIMLYKVYRLLELGMQIHDQLTNKTQKLLARWSFQRERKDSFGCALNSLRLFTNYRPNKLKMFPIYILIAFEYEASTSIHSKLHDDAKLPPVSALQPTTLYYYHSRFLIGIWQRQFNQRLKTVYVPLTKLFWQFYHKCKKYFTAL